MTLKINRLLPLFIGSVHTQFEKDRVNGSAYILPTRNVDDATDGQTDGPTDRRTTPYHNTYVFDGRIKTYVMYKQA